VARGLDRVLRAQRVILDRELARIYDVATQVLNQAVKRNIDRFPEDFMFRLTREEAVLSRSQTVILNARRGLDIKHLPFAFTEHGAIQAANILNSKRAAAMGVYVVRAFVRLRTILASHKELARRLGELERSLVHQDAKVQRQFKEVYEHLQGFTTAAATRRRPIGFTANLDEAS
jgi:hypothetical protein